jgi:hypothetical protein
MTVTFITSGTKISGGTKAIFEIANQFVDLGHKVFVVCSLTPYFLEGKWYNFADVLTRLLRIFKKSRECIYPIKWFDLKAEFIPALSLREKYIPDADIVVATWWQTAYPVAEYSTKKGKKFYFVQDYEIWGGSEKKVQNSYNLNLKKIVNSSWLENILKQKIDVEIEAKILHAPDHKQFYPEKIKKNKNEIRILMSYRNNPRKGTINGLRAIKLVRKKYPDIKLVLFGPRPDSPEKYNLVKDIEFHIFPVKDELRRLYNSCDIFCYPTIEEAFGMPPMEAMACRIPVIATTAGAIPEYSINGKTALLSKPSDVKTMAKNIIKLIEDENLRKKIAITGQNHIKQFTWKKITVKLEKIFEKYAKAN